MSLPAVTRNWTFAPNNRIPFVSLVDTMRSYLFGVKAFLTANGYTVKGSCDGINAAMDGVDRWISPNNINTRSGNTTSPQSWMVLTDGSGVDILLCYQGATNDAARLSFSPSGKFVAAGVSVNQPLAADEQVICSGSLIGTEASADRLWSGWVSNDKRACRFMVVRSGSMVNAKAAAWGIENVASTVETAVFAPQVWGFSLPGAANVLGNGGLVESGSQIGVARVVVASNQFTCVAKFGMETYAGSTSTWNDVKPELQGSSGYPMYPLAIGSTTAGATGKLGNLVDWWTGRVGNADGDVYGNNQFIAIVAHGQIVWPWDGKTTPVLT